MGHGHWQSCQVQSRRTPHAQGEEHHLQGGHGAPQPLEEVLDVHGAQGRVSSVAGEVG